METVVVERELSSPGEEAEIRALASSHGCSELYRVTILRSYLSADGKRLICVYEAPDAEAVRTVQRKAGLPFTRVWSCATDAE